MIERGWDGNILEIRPHPKKGRGVFALRVLPQDFLLERTPVIVIPAEEWPWIERTVLRFYCFSWGPNGDQAALALGVGSLFNHSYTPNALYRKDFREQVIEFITLRPVAAGEEITVNYGGHPYSRIPMWFKLADEKDPFD